MEWANAELSKFMNNSKMSIFAIKKVGGRGTLLHDMIAKIHNSMLQSV